MRRWIYFFLALNLFLSSMAFAAGESCGAVFLWREPLVAARVQKNKFTTSRDLFEYQHTLHEGFKQSLANLRADQHWVDLGAGKANAQVDYLKSIQDLRQAPQTTAVAYKLDRWFSPPKFGGKLAVKEGAFETQDTASWKKADLVTDVFGVLSYSSDMHTSLQKVFDMMNVGGELYVYANNYATSFVSYAQGRKAFSMIDFLSSVEGLKVEGRFGTFKVTKEKEDIVIPRLELRGYKDDAPPIRSFEILPW